MPPPPKATATVEDAMEEDPRPAADEASGAGAGAGAERKEGSAAMEEDEQSSKRPRVEPRPKADLYDSIEESSPKTRARRVVSGSGPHLCVGGAVRSRGEHRPLVTGWTRRTRRMRVWRSR
jgi:hypothetical protein